MAWAPNWLTERVNELKALWASGLTATQVGKRLGVSRGAVLGKLHRENGAVRAPLPKSQRPKRKPPTRKVVQYEPPKLSLEPIELVNLPPDESPFACSIIELTAKSCRWPLDNHPTVDVPMRYCGAPMTSGSYCSRHARIAWHSHKQIGGR
jgi:GcrA cell cycle regulator